MAITNKDIDKITEKMREIFATKDDLFKVEAKLEKFATKDDHREVMTTLDKVMDELVKAREDRTLAIGKDREQDRRLDGLETRTLKIEAKAG